mmetsp:Transcript_37907/g.79908  ORF Transcript_37907/g.79908 Transcript_37907/m.79908 type:complete len:237 (-) Transcript_37907:152-862(-)
MAAARMSSVLLDLGALDGGAGDLELPPPPPPKGREILGSSILGSSGTIDWDTSSERSFGFELAGGGVDGLAAATTGSGFFSTTGSGFFSTTGSGFFFSTTGSGLGSGAFGFSGSAGATLSLNPGMISPSVTPSDSSSSFFFSPSSAAAALLSSDSAKRHHFWLFEWHTGLGAFHATATSETKDRVVVATDGERGGANPVEGARSRAQRMVAAAAMPCLLCMMMCFDVAAISIISRA